MSPLSISSFFFPKLPLLFVSPHPFGVGISEGSGNGEGIWGWMMAQQSVFEQLLLRTIQNVDADVQTILLFLGISFLYGVFHAAGPGHGKVVLSSYLIAHEHHIARGFFLSFAAALLQGSVAIALVGIILFVLQGTATQLKFAATQIEMLGYVIICFLGLYLTFHRGKALFHAFLAIESTAPQTPTCTCGHPHIHVPPSAHPFSWRHAAGTLFAAGIRPCTGAILLLVFASAQGAFWLGVLAVLLLSLGTASTTGIIALLSLYAKKKMLQLSQRSGKGMPLLSKMIEFAAALLVLGLGIFLLAAGVTTSHLG